MRAGWGISLCMRRRPSGKDCRITAFSRHGQCRAFTACMLRFLRKYKENNVPGNEGLGGEVRMKTTVTFGLVPAFIFHGNAVDQDRSAPRRRRSAARSLCAGLEINPEFRNSRDDRSIMKIPTGSKAQ